MLCYCDLSLLYMKLNNFSYIENPESLDKIESQVRNKFWEIPNRDRSCPHFPGQPCTSEHLQVTTDALVLAVFLFLQDSVMCLISILMMQYNR